MPADVPKNTPRYSRLRRRCAVVSLGAVVFCAACWGSVSRENEGDVCFAQRGSDVEVTVTACDCLSGSCSRDVGGNCDAMVMGTTIEITSEIHWEDRGGQCTDDCQRASVTCTIATPPAGDYSVVFGDQQQQVTVPVVEDCAGPLPACN
jgi:hypothetical protein